MAFGFTFKDNSDKVKVKVDAATRRALTAAGGQAEAYCKLELERNPHRIDTGLLRNSITYALAGEAPATKRYKGDRPSQYKNDGVIPEGSYDGKAPNDSEGLFRDRHTVYVGTNVEYAEYVHEGTTTMEPNHFIRNGVERNAEDLKSILKEYYRGIN